MKLKEFARLVGMSQTTVSRALNGHPEVAEQTRLRLIAELGEGPLASPLARELDLGALITRLVATHPCLTSGQAVPTLARSLAALMEEPAPSEGLTIARY